VKGRVGEGICWRDLPTTVGRKPRRFWSVRLLVMLPHAPGLSHSLRADNCYFGVRFDWGNAQTWLWAYNTGRWGLRDVSSCFSLGRKVL
jgi:hypothetical protein